MKMFEEKLQNNIPAWKDARPTTPFWTSQGMYTQNPSVRTIKITRTTEIIEIQESQKDEPELAPGCWERLIKRCCG